MEQLCQVDLYLVFKNIAVSVKTFFGVVVGAAVMVTTVMIVDVDAVRLKLISASSVSSDLFRTVYIFL